MTEHWEPEKPRSQWQTPAAQWPWEPQATPSHGSTEQSCTDQPLRHSQVPSWQRPLVPQLTDRQASWLSHCAPDQPASHLHIGCGSTDTAAAFAGWPWASTPSRDCCSGE